MTPTLWLGVAAVVSLACLVWLTLDLRRQPLPRILLFVVYAVFFRFVLSAFHPITFPSLVGPLSINALYSVFVIGCGFLVIDRRLLRLKYLLPVYGLLLIVMVSAVVNGTLKESIETLLKWLFFIVIALAVYESLVKTAREIVLDKLFKAFSVPLAMQLMSVLLGYSKRSESDNSISYVGGYYHEAVFSVILITAMVLAALLQLSLLKYERGRGVTPILISLGVAFTNYRTNIIAMLLPLTGYVYFRFVRKGLPLAKVGATVLLVCGATIVALMDFSAIVERFAEIGTVLESASELIKSPVYYTEWEQDYFSARVYIWSQYLDAYVNGSTLQHLIGYGADSWSRLFPKYAHNTFVSYLFELGVLGFLGLLYLFVRNMQLCFRGSLTTYKFLLFLCFVGFLVMNLGTMPLWQVEGMVLFAILNALVWDLQLQYAIHGRESWADQDDQRHASQSLVTETG